MVYDLQKADMWKRISAALFDFTILCVVIMIFALLLSWVTGYDTYSKALEDIEKSYAEKYDIDLNLYGTEEYEKLSDEDKARYELANKMFQQDEQAILLYQVKINLVIFMSIASVVLGYVVLEFIIPLIFKNGQTLGKKIFGIAVIRYDLVKITPLLLFVRSILGKCTVETLLPALVLVMSFTGGGIFSLIIVILYFIAQIAFFLFTRERTLVHDVMAQTVAVDMSSQMIFDSPEALLEYKQKLQAEKAARSDY